MYLQLFSHLLIKPIISNQSSATLKKQIDSENNPVIDGKFLITKRINLKLKN